MKPYRTVTIVNDTDRSVKLGFNESWDNTWHTAVSVDLPLEPNDRYDLEYQSGDSIFVGNLAEADLGMGVREEFEYERSQDSLNLVKQHEIRIELDSDSGKLIFVPTIASNP